MIFKRPDPREHGKSPDSWHFFLFMMVHRIFCCLTCVFLEILCTLIFSFSILYLPMSFNSFGSWEKILGPALKADSRRRRGRESEKKYKIHYSTIYGKRSQASSKDDSLFDLSQKRGMFSYSHYAIMVWYSILLCCYCTSSSSSPSSLVLQRSRNEEKKMTIFYNTQKGRLCKRSPTMHNYLRHEKGYYFTIHSTQKGETMDHVPFVTRDFSHGFRQRLSVDTDV
jgi:hypothetical protein